MKLSLSMFVILQLILLIFMNLSGFWKLGHFDFDLDFDSDTTSSSFVQQEQQQQQQPVDKPLSPLSPLNKSREDQLEQELERVKAELVSMNQKLERYMEASQAGHNTMPQQQPQDNDEFRRFSQLVHSSTVLSLNRTHLLAPQTDTLMRKSRPIVGNTQRLRTFLQKLLNGTCTTLAFVGGSVTWAKPDGRGGFVYGYHKDFVNYLNERYPCFTNSRDDDNTQQAGQHSLYVHGPGGTDSAYAVQNFNQLFRGAGGHLDFLSFEYAVNDASAAELPGRTLAETVQINTEILYRKALRYRNPDDGSAPAVICLESSFFNKNLLQRDMHTTYGAAHVFTAGLHYPILTYYDIPTISAAQIWLPQLAKDLEQLKNRSLPITNVFADTCHPSDQGHTVIAQLLAYQLETEKEWMLRGDPPSDTEQDLTLQNPPKFPNPWWLTDQQVAVMVDAPTSEFSFQMDAPEPESLLFNNGWSLYADSKNKVGLIANRSASHVAFAVQFENFDQNASQRMISFSTSPEGFKKQKGALAHHMSTAMDAPSHKLTLGYLKTYTNVSNLLLWTDDQPDGRDLCTQMVATSPGFCHEVGCSCEYFKSLDHATRWRYWGFIMKLEQHGLCVNNVTGLNFTSAEPRPQLYAPTELVSPDLGVVSVDPLQTIQTSVYSHIDVSLSKVAIAAAVKGDPIYVHACSTRFGEWTDPAIASLAKKPAPFSGDAKFKLLLVGATNGKVKIEKQNAPAA